MNINSNNLIYNSHNVEEVLNRRHGFLVLHILECHLLFHAVIYAK